MRKLKQPADPLALLFDRARELGPHLGPVLYQLPPRWAPNHERLEAFLQALPGDVPQAIEFREAAWYTDRTFDLLSRWNVALCLHDMAGSATPRLVVGPLVYVRFHGASAKYGGSYSAAQLEGWAVWLGAQRARGIDVYAYFNNDAGGHAPRNAVTLREALAQPRGKLRAAGSRVFLQENRGDHATGKDDGPGPGSGRAGRRAHCTPNHEAVPGRQL
jgi:uncharacterized protein YecE (DUF72 family)